jgi:hypothetical protein
MEKSENGMNSNPAAAAANTVEFYLLIVFQFLTHERVNRQQHEHVQPKKPFLEEGAEKSNLENWNSQGEVVTRSRLLDFPRPRNSL